MKSILINYEFGISATAGFDAICSTDQRNLWCALLVQAIRDEMGMQPLFPQDVTAENISSVVCEIHINARKPISNAPLIGLFMETPAVVPQNNPQTAQAYQRVISFDHALRHLPNFIEANLPCWSPTFKLHENTARSGYAMIAGNKRLDQSKVQKDLYAERRKIIKWFSKSNRNDFYLYGAGWNIPLFALDHPRLSSFWKANKLPGTLQCYQGRVEKKYTVLQSFRFNYCVENCIYPGYISEKLFDAIISGCIPIYWRGPHMEDVIPDACFVDASKFRNPSALIEHCDGLGEKEVAAIQQNGRHFLEGHGRLFTHETYSDIVKAALVDGI